MGQDLKRFIAAICDQHGDILGTGFVIAPNVVATCAHVVAAAEVDPGGTVAVKLPDADTLYPAEFLAENYDFANDVAILKCHATLPDVVQPAILGRWQEARHTPFQSYGYRPLDIYRGNPAEGQLLREVADIHPRPGEPQPTHPVLSLASQQVNAGMSGAPVYIPATDRVVGMITAIWNRAGRDRDTAFAVSAEAIAAAWPEVRLHPAEGNTMTHQDDRASETPSGFLSLTPAWIKPYFDIRPLPTDDDAITTILQGYSPFPNPRAEAEKAFLFGSAGGFWSGHTVYAQVAGNPVAQVVLAETGGGKTALAYALRQVGTPDGNPIPYTLPVVLNEHLPLSMSNAKNRMAHAISRVLHDNPAALVRLPSAEKTLVVRFLVNQLGPAAITDQLPEAIQQDRSLPELISRFSQTGPQASATWLRQAQSVLAALGFRQIVLAIDANRRPASEITGWLTRMQNWSSFDIHPVLLLPLERQPEFDKLLAGAAAIRVLTWTERQLTAMAIWRFERLVNRIGVHISLEELFEDKLWVDFVQVSNLNPGRMARLWEKMAKRHAENQPTKRMFSGDDLLRAVEQVG
jgi:hypothetical protein